MESTIRLFNVGDIVYPHDCPWMRFTVVETKMESWGQYFRHHASPIFYFSLRYNKVVPNEDMMTSLEKREKEMADAISNFVNGFGDGQRVAKLMANDHPTLQQGMMRFFMNFAKEMARQPHPDARNHGSVDLAKKIIALEYHLPRV